jgi:hypothetical protein
LWPSGPENRKPPDGSRTWARVVTGGYETKGSFWPKVGSSVVSCPDIGDTSNIITPSAENADEIKTATIKTATLKTASVSIGSSAVSVVELSTIGSPTVRVAAAAAASDVGGAAMFRFYLDEKVPFVEDDRTEFKVSFSSHADHWARYRRTIAAFLNTRGGTLYFGIDDHGIVKGLSHPRCKDDASGSAEADKAADRFRLWVDQTARHLLQPAIYNLSVHVHKVTRDLSVWAVTVPASPVPVYFQNTVYRRMNASTVLYRQQTVVTAEQLAALKAAHQHDLDTLAAKHRAALDAAAADHRLNMEKLVAEAAAARTEHRLNVDKLIADAAANQATMKSQDAKHRAAILQLQADLTSCQSGLRLEQERAERMGAETLEWRSRQEELVLEHQVDTAQLEAEHRNSIQGVVKQERRRLIEIGQGYAERVRAHAAELVREQAAECCRLVIERHALDQKLAVTCRRAIDQQSILRTQNIELIRRLETTRASLARERLRSNYLDQLDRLTKTIESPSAAEPPSTTHYPTNSCRQNAMVAPANRYANDGMCARLAMASACYSAMFSQCRYAMRWRSFHLQVCLWSDLSRRWPMGKPPHSSSPSRLAFAALLRPLRRRRPNPTLLWRWQNAKPIHPHPTPVPILIRLIPNT